MATRSRYVSGRLTFFDSVTFETVGQLAPVTFYDDFLGNALLTSLWTARDTGAATEALGTSIASGAVALTLDATNEVQLAGIDWNDQKPLVLNQGLIFEARFRFSVLPGTGTLACVGLSGSHNAAVDTVAESMWFRADASGAITVETDDGTNETSKVATGVTLLATDWVVGRIDVTDPTSVKFFLNGVRVAQSTTFTMAAAPTATLQPACRIGKESAVVGVGTLLVDYVRVAQNRS